MVDDVLIPVRLLLNGASIARDELIDRYTYYHVELEQHGILFANGLTTESYLDTGNRASFANADVPMLLHPDLEGGQAQRVAQSCKPFVDDAARVEPIWRRIAVRAMDLGLALPEACETTQEPALHLVVGDRTIKPISLGGRRYGFMLPATDAAVRLVSRAAKPCDVRPWVEDHRRLGVMVSRMTLKYGAMAEPIPMDHPRLSNGWWDVEREGAAIQRWTNGDALLPLPSSVKGPALLEVTLTGSLDYPVSKDVVIGAYQPSDRGNGHVVAA
jgi:hypothetical protein